LEKNAPVIGRARPLARCLPASRFSTWPENAPSLLDLSQFPTILSQRLERGRISAGIKKMCRFNVLARIRSQG
jgi:hypothetical protein